MIVRAIAFILSRRILFFLVVLLTLLQVTWGSYRKGCRRKHAKGETVNEAIIIENEENGLHKLEGHSEAAMTHVIEESWHWRLSHFNYKVLPYICKAVTGLLELKGDHEGVCNGCAQGKNIKNPFLKRDNKAEGVLELIHSDVCGSNFIILH